jgi:hypothetical protein
MLEGIEATPAPAGQSRMPALDEGMALTLGRMAQ